MSLFSISPLSVINRLLFIIVYSLCSVSLVNFIESSLNFTVGIQVSTWLSEMRCLMFDAMT